MTDRYDRDYAESILSRMHERNRNYRVEVPASMEALNFYSSHEISQTDVDDAIYEILDEFEMAHDRYDTNMRHIKMGSKKDIKISIIELIEDKTFLLAKEALGTEINTVICVDMNDSFTGTDFGIHFIKKLQEKFKHSVFHYGRTRILSPNEIEAMIVDGTILRNPKYVEAVDGKMD